MGRSQNRSLGVGTAVALALGLLVLTTAPAAALTFKGQGMYSTFSWGKDNGGIAVLDRTAGDDPRLTVGLKAGASEVLMVMTFRSIGCGGNPSNSNKVLQISGMTDENGAFFRTRSVSRATAFDAIRSVWVKAGTDQVCALSLNFEEIKVTVVGDWDGDGVLSAQTGDGQILGNLLLIEKRPNGSERVTFVYDGAEPGDSYTVRGVPRQCGRASAAAPLALEIENAQVSSYVVATVDLSQEELDSIRSIRLRNATAGYNAGCQNSIIMANTEGD